MLLPPPVARKHVAPQHSDDRDLPAADRDLLEDVQPYLSDLRVDLLVLVTLRVPFGALPALVQTIGTLDCRHVVCLLQKVPPRMHTRTVNGY